ncbi:cation channel sperm-associated auxiliary subunit epsilon-like isoform X2 [Ptychodera flava]|uniref:cation channel sperm-associated auxiliary subunit epsilon-like isoform X2 n=1 Tax=Ptychodera flava TaxID=63121 RepID=UPI00396A556B
MYWRHMLKCEVERLVYHHVYNYGVNLNIVWLYVSTRNTLRCLIRQLTCNVYRFHVPGIDIGATFNTRSPFQVEYLLDTNTTLTWSASNGCHIYNKSAPLTQIQCREAGVHTISLQEKNGVSMETSQTIMVVDDPMCYSWYLATVGSSQSVSISTEPESYTWRLWIVDPQYADNREVNLTAILPSQHSADLTSQFIAKRQDPVMDIMPVVMGQKLTVVSKTSHPNLGYWDVTADLKFQDSYQMAVNIQGKPHIAVGNCFIKNTDILISRPKFMLSEVQSTDWTQLRGTNSSPVIVQDACATNVAALLTRDGVYITQDSFVTTHPLWIEKSLVQGLSDPVVGDIAFSEYHLFVLTGSKIFVRNTTAEEFILIEELPASGIIGLRGRQTYLTACTRQVHPAVVAWSNNTVYGITISGDISFPQVSRHPLPDLMSRMDFSPGNSSLSIEDVAYTVFPSDIGVTVKLDDANHSVSIVMTLNLESNTWNYLPFHAISSGFNLLFIAGVSQSLIFWDSRNIYYSLHSGAEIGVISVDQCSSHLSACLNQMKPYNK